MLARVPNYCSSKSLLDLPAPEPLGISGDVHVINGIPVNSQGFAIFPFRFANDYIAVSDTLFEDSCVEYPVKIFVKRWTRPGISSDANRRSLFSKSRRNRPIGPTPLVKSPRSV